MGYNSKGFSGIWYVFETRGQRERDVSRRSGQRKQMGRG